MLHVGLDLSRKRVDVCLIPDRGELVDELAAPFDEDGLCRLTERVAAKHAGLRGGSRLLTLRNAEVSGVVRVSARARPQREPGAAEPRRLPSRESTASPRLAIRSARDRVRGAGSSSFALGGRPRSPRAGRRFIAAAGADSMDGWPGLASTNGELLPR